MRVPIILLATAGFGLAVYATVQASDRDWSKATADNLNKETERCKTLHEKALNDPSCQAASKEISRRFFVPPSDYQPAPVEMFPKADKQQWTTDKRSAPAATGN